MKVKVKLHPEVEKFLRENGDVVRSRFGISKFRFNKWLEETGESGIFNIIANEPYRRPNEKDMKPTEYGYVRKSTHQYVRELDDSFVIRLSVNKIEPKSMLSLYYMGVAIMVKVLENDKHTELIAATIDLMNYCAGYSKSTDLSGPIWYNKVKADEEKIFKAWIISGRPCAWEKYRDSKLKEL